MCFAFNPIVGYELAKELMPQEDWYVKETYCKQLGDCIDAGHDPRLIKMKHTISIYPLLTMMRQDK